MREAGRCGRQLGGELRKVSRLMRSVLMSGPRNDCKPCSMGGSRGKGDAEAEDEARKRSAGGSRRQ